MRNRYPCATALLAVVLPMASAAQHWVELMLDGTTNLHAVKAAFDAEWEGRPYQPGKGWKQFQRWWWFWDQRTWPTGERPDPNAYLQALEEVAALRAHRGNLRDAAQWESLGPRNWTSWSYNPGNGRVNCVALDPVDPQIVYAGTPSGGLWRFVPGQGWSPLFEDHSSMGVSAIAIRPGDPNTIYIATGDGDGADTFSAGVLKTTDGGATWQPTGLNWNITQSLTTRALRLHPSDTGLLYCAASNGLFRTSDGGDTWQQVAGGSFRDVEFMPGDSTVVFACTDRFYRSEDGVSFDPIAAGLPSASEVGRMAIAVCPAEPQVVYALCSGMDNGFLGLYRSTDGGLTFETRSTQPNILGYAEDGSDTGGQAWYDMALAVDPVNPDIVYAGGINVWKSSDGGATWSIVSHWVYPSIVGYTHADIHSLDVLNGELWCGSDGGIFVSPNAGLSWTNRSFGLDITQFYRLGGSELAPHKLMAGAQDNGSNRYLAGEWTHVHGADGMECAVDRADPTILYASSQNGGLMRSTNNGVSWDGLADAIDDEGSWVTPFELHPTDATVMVAGFQNLWFSADRGDNWYQTTFWLSNNAVNAIAFAPSAPDVMYVARNDKVVRSMDGGFSWTNIRPGLPNLSPTSFAVDPTDPMHVWISFSGTSNMQKVYESTDGGGIWANRSAGLPNVPCNSIVFQPGSPNGVYLGTDVGVFYRDDHTGAWELYGTGLPNVVVTELEVNMSAGKLRAATYGRGIWQADLFFSPFATVGGEAGTEPPLLVPIDGEGRFGVRAGEGLGRLLDLRVCDATGRVLPVGRTSHAPPVVDLSGHRAGTYLVTLTFERGTWTQRVLTKVW